jgi:hypothetical protein
MFFEDSEVEDETFMEVGRIMQRSWMAAMAAQFPGRQFVVELLDSEDDWHGPTLYLASAPLALNDSAVPLCLDSHLHASDCAIPTRSCSSRRQTTPPGRGLGMP